MDRLDHLFLKFLHKHSKAYQAARPAEQYSASKDEDYSMREEVEVTKEGSDDDTPDHPEGAEEHTKEELWAY